MDKAVMLSINPVWCEKIISGRKTMELRKNIPRAIVGESFEFKPFKCYIYCTLSGSNELIKGLGFRDAQTLWNRGNWGERKGHVIGEFMCDFILHRCEMGNADIAEQKSLVKREDIAKYSGGKDVYGWNITELKVYDKPKEIERFGLKRAPQSWCYVDGERRTLKRGDVVIMTDKYFDGEKYQGRKWTVASSPWMCCGTEVVKLVGLNGSYATDGLKLVGGCSCDHFKQKQGV